jgi:tetratricopeptide (TPR) repeat protein
MTRKKLKAHTIIPQNLYVERAADRQVKDILEDMGRPGYVLVARQMGKTNLLLNAKRTFSSEEDIFAYLDVSNTFPSIQGFFRNIIDVVLEQLEGRADALSREILAGRESLELLPHKEHEVELRTILRKIEGKLVICLDEIDALTKTAYSDQAFSLIRSIYFSGRANFPEFSRLTYLLSGVAEPADIIKNKEISPFNIGEKIYLDDFSIVEFHDFLRRTGLSFSVEVSQAIYGWTSGNPRMTWDLCSAVEDAIIEKGQVSPDDVSSIVKRLYLTQFDLPPIDHIRKLVEDDKDIRSAVMAIHYEKSETVSDPLRNRLYLAGVCCLDSASRRLSIKNKIIELSLSEEWIRQVDREKLSLEKLAKQYFDVKDYDAAKATYLELLAQTTDNVDKSIPYYYLGQCYFKTYDYANAVKALSEQPIKKNYAPALYLDSRNVLGLSNFYLGNFAEAKALFEEVVSNTDAKENAFEYYQAKSSYGSALLSFDKDSTSEAVDIWQEVVDFSTTRTDEPDNKYAWQNLNALARANLAQGLMALGRHEESKSHLIEAIEISPVSVRPERLLMLAQLEVDRPKMVERLTAAVQCVVENGVIITPESDTTRGFNARACLALVSELQSSGQHVLLQEFLKYLIENFEKHEVDVAELSERLIVRLMELRAQQSMRQFLELITNRNPLSASECSAKRTGLAFIIVLDQQECLEYKEDYYEALRTVSYSSVPYDIAAIFIIVMKQLGAGDIDGAVQSVDISEKLRWENDIPVGGELVFEYLRFLTKLRRNPGAEVYSSASSFISKLRTVKAIRIPFFSENFCSTMDKTLRGEMLRRVRTHQIVRNGKKIGRNENITVRYSDGRVVSSKYKLVADDLENGNCRII